MVAVAAALLACNEAAPPTTTAAAPAAPVVPVPGGGSSPALPSAPTAPVAPTAPAVPVFGGGSSPALPSVVGNIVFEINTGAAPTRSSSIASLPPIDGTRQDSTIISERIRKTFPVDFTHDGPTTAAELLASSSDWIYPWKLEQEAPAITQDWLDNGGTVIPSYSLNGGTEWFSGSIPAYQLSTDGIQRIWRIRENRNEPRSSHRPRIIRSSLPQLGEPLCMHYY